MTIKIFEMIIESENKISSKEEILESLREVMDPEIPVLSVVDLGIIEDVVINGEAVTVKMIPTFTACPAIKIMQQEIKDKILFLGFEEVNVIVDGSVSWNSDRMSEEG